MSRIRSHRYITKIYNSSNCTKYMSISTKNLCNIAKRNFYLNPVSITLQSFQSAKFALITFTITSNRKYTLVEIFQLTHLLY